LKPIRKNNPHYFEGGIALNYFKIFKHVFSKVFSSNNCLRFTNKFNLKQQNGKLGKEVCGMVYEAGELREVCIIVNSDMPSFLIQALPFVAFKQISKGNSKSFIVEVDHICQSLSTIFSRAYYRATKAFAKICSPNFDKRLTDAKTLDAKYSIIVELFEKFTNTIARFMRRILAI
jgi:hypothetical protein